MSEREFWLAVRRALLMICAAIEKRYLQPRKDLPRELRGEGDDITDQWLNGTLNQH